MTEGVSAVIFEGTAPASPVEEMITRVRRAAVLDNLDKVKQVPLIKETYLVTNDRDLAGAARANGAQVLENDIPPEKFHLGRSLQDLVVEHNLKKVFYFSGAGCPLITVEEIASICRLLVNRERFLYSNNTQSADIVAFTVTGDLSGADLPAVDNSLAWALRDYLGLEQELMPYSLGLLFDLDTPADLLVLGAGPFPGPRTRAVLDTCDLDYTRLNQAKAIMRGHYEDVFLIGRVGGPVMERLNSTLKLRLRVFSEERGMKALGRMESGAVISMLGLLLDHAGLERFFTYLSRVSHCAFIDSRVLMAHYCFHLSEKERFLSDLGLWRQIEHPWLKEFTRAAVECTVPVVLGGHSLVSGSLWALSCELAGLD
ncbi:MAG: hypothetical protein AB1767_00355 [Bacillota bacterium]